MEREKRLWFGREFTVQELDQIRETVWFCRRLRSRTEIAYTLCEHLGWVTPAGRYRLNACLQLLSRLEEAGQVELPPAQQRRRRTEVGPPLTARTEAVTEIKGPLAAWAPVTVEPVADIATSRLWNEYVQRYHPLGYKRPFGAHQRYFVCGGDGQERLGCLLFAASAWQLAARDAWIGWSVEDRSQRLNGVVNNTRFLIFPWVQIPNLASKALALVTRRIRSDWQARYRYEPVLLETFVDRTRYEGICYRAANWLELGETAGRGRMDRYKEYRYTPKRIYVYPLVPDFRAYLCGQRTYLNDGPPLREGEDDE